MPRRYPEEVRRQVIELARSGTKVALDLSIAFIAFALWAAWEGRRLRMRSWWVPIPASLLVGLCFALPLFLLLRERAIQPEDARGRASD